MVILHTLIFPLLVAIIALTNGQMQVNINNTVNNQIDLMDIHNNTIIYNNFGQGKNESKWIDGILDKIRREGGSSFSGLLGDEDDENVEDRDSISNGIPEDNYNNKEYRTDERAKYDVNALEESIKVIRNNRKDTHSRNHKAYVPSYKQPSLINNARPSWTRHEERKMDDDSSGQEVIIITNDQTTPNIPLTTKYYTAVPRYIPSTTPKIIPSVIDIEKSIVYSSADEARSNLTSHLNEIYAKCVNTPYNSITVDKIKKNSLLILEDILMSRHLFSSDYHFRGLTIQIVLRNVINEMKLSGLVKDECLMDELTSMGRRIAMSINDDVRSLIQVKQNELGLTESKRVRRSLQSSDDEFFSSLSRKSADSVLFHLKESGVLLSGKKENPELAMINSSVATSSILSTRLSISKNGPMIAMLRFPMLNWLAPLQVDYYKKKDRGLEGDFIHLERAESILGHMPMCKQLPVWKFEDPKVAKCINKLSLILFEDDTFCRLTAQCNGTLLNHYTCSDTINPDCKGSTIYTNHESYGFLNHRRLKFHKISSDSFHKSNLILHDQGNEIFICSIGNFWKSHKSCNNSLTYFGEVQFSLMEDGSVEISTMSINGNYLSFNKSDINHYTCSDPDCFEDSKEGLCTGDKDYCTHVSKECPMSSSKHCHLIKNSIGYKSRRTGSLVLAYYIIWANINYDIKIIDELEGVNMITVDNELLYFQTGCNYTHVCSGLNLMLESNCHPIKAVLKLGSSYTWYNFVENSESSDQYEMALPFSIMKGGLQPTLTVYGEKGIILREMINCPPSNICDTIKCFLCKSKLLNPRCLTQTERIVLTLIIVSILLTIGVSIFMIVKKTSYKLKPAIRKGFRVISNGGKTLLRNFSTRSSSKNSLNSPELEGVVTQGSNSSNEIDSGSLMGRRKENRQIVFKRRSQIGSFSFVSNSNRFIKNKFDLQSMILIALLFLYKESSACSDSTTFISEQKECIYDSMNQKVCKISTSMRVSGPPIGHTTCINLMSPEEEMQGYVSIRVVANLYHCMKSSLYYTTQTKLNVKSISNCPGVGECASWKSCMTYLNSSETQSRLFPNTINKLAMFECHTPNGCAGNGCWRCDNACLFSSAEFIRSNDQVYEIFNCPTWIPRLSLEVKFHNIPSMTDFTIGLEGSEKHEIDGFSISKIADSSPITSNDFCLVRDDVFTYLASCQKGTELQAGSIGEVRCPDHKSAEDLNKACSYSKSMVGVKNINWDVVYQNKQINIKEAISKSKLPFLHGSSIVDKTADGNIILKNTVGETYELQVNLKNIEVSIRKEKSTCFGENLSINGCYSCLGGATMNLTIEATRDDTLGFISCPGLNSIPIIVNKTRSNISFQIFVLTKISGEGCYVKCSGNSVSLKAEVHLTEQVMLKLDEDEITISNSTSGGANITDFLKQNWWYMIPTFSIGGLVMAGTVVVCIYQNLLRKRNDLTILPMSIMSKSNAKTE